MRKVRFIGLSEGYLGAFDDATLNESIEKSTHAIENTFLESERGVTSNDIKQFANQIACEIKKFLAKHSSSQEELSLIVENFLTTDSILKGLYNNYEFNVANNVRPFVPDYKQENVHYRLTWKNSQGEVQVGSFEPNELEEFLYPIRQAVLNELQHVLDVPIHMLSKRLTQDGRIWNLHQDKIMRLAKDHSPNPPINDEPESFYKKNKEDQNKALATLYSLNERSPYLAYPILEADFETGSGKGWTVETKLPIITLEKFLNKKPLPPLVESLGYVLDAMKGADFLIKHNLRLTDFHPSNIAINTETDTGLLFDYDGLRAKDTIVEGYPTHIHYLPPERRPIKPPGYIPTEIPFPPKFKQIEKPIEEAEMVYEFGILIHEIFKKYNLPDLEKKHQFETAASHNPKERPSINDVITAVTQLINKLKNN